MVEWVESDVEGLSGGVGGMRQPWQRGYMATTAMVAAAVAIVA